MKFKCSKNSIRVYALIFIPFFIFVAIEGTFSVQSVIPIIALLCFSIFLKDAKRANRKKMYNNIRAVSASLFIFSAFSSMCINLLGYNDLISANSIIRILYYLAILFFFFALIDTSTSEEDISNIMAANVLAGVGVAISLILKNHIWFYNFLGIRMDKNFIGAILAIQAEIALIKILKEKNKKRKMVWIIFFSVIVLGIFYSASRASLLVVLFGSATIIFYNFKSNKNKSKGAAKQIIFIVVLPIIVLTVFLIISSKITNSNNIVQWYWNRYFVNGFGDDSVVGRVEWWKEALGLWSRRPLFGYGIGNVNVSGNSSAVAHNTYIDFLVDQGIIGFLGYIIILFYSIKRVFENKSYIVYGIVFSLLLNSLILSATKSTYLWYTLILIHILGEGFSTKRKVTI